MSVVEKLKQSDFVNKESMSFGEREEFIIMLLLENRCLKQEGESFHSYISKKCDIETFNQRYKELLDKFLTKYALTTTEKSD